MQYHCFFYISIMITLKIIIEIIQLLFKKISEYVKTRNLFRGLSNSITV